MLRSTAVFERQRSARRVCRALQQFRFECVELHADTIRRRPDGAPDVDYLERLGLGTEESDRYAEVIDSGSTVLLVGCPPGRAEQLFDIMGEFGFRKTTRSHRADRLRFRRPSDADVEHRRADTEQSRPTNADDASGSDSPLRSLSEGFPGVLTRFERAFRRHYEDHYLDADPTYGDFARAYHYGVILAEYAGFRDQTWERIAPYAAQGWDESTHGDWERFREATRYGWERVRERRRR